MPFEASWMQKQLGRELAELREARHLTHREVGERLEWNHTKVGRIERAENKISDLDVIRLAKLYGVPDAEIERLRSMARESRTDRWWEKYRPWINDAYYEVIGYENDATRLHVVRPSVVHGLLQTRRYMEALHATGVLIRDEERIAANIEVRALRQRRLHEPEPLRLDLTMTDTVLDMPVGGTEVLNEQLRHLRELIELPNVVIRVIPATTPIVVDTIEILEFGAPEGPAIALTEVVFGAVIHDDPMEVRQARRVLESIRAAAWSPEESTRLIEEKIKETST
jgi:transcriptional regulator with XRE-family HTH domain